MKVVRSVLINVKAYNPYNYLNCFNHLCLFIKIDFWNWLFGWSCLLFSSYLTNVKQEMLVMFFLLAGSFTGVASLATDNAKKVSAQAVLLNRQHLNKQQTELSCVCVCVFDTFMCNYSKSIPLLLQTAMQI